MCPVSLSHSHDHGRCISDALSRANALCEQKGVRLTPVRKRVLELIWNSHKPTGAYDLLPQLAEDGFNSAPPTVYRALDFLLELGLIHRITSFNAYIGCNHPEEAHPTGFFICRQCGNATELPNEQITGLTSQLAEQLGVVVENSTHEITGICARCRQTS